MSAADSGGGAPIGVGAFISWVGGRALRFGRGSDKPTFYQAGVGKISRGSYRAALAERQATFAANKAAYQASITQTQTGGQSTTYVPPSDAEWERRRQAQTPAKSPAKSPPPPKGPTPADKYPMPPGLPAVFRGVWGNLIAYAVIWALPYIYKKASESWQEYFARWQKREAEHRAATSRRKPGGPGQKPRRTPAEAPRSPDRPGVPTSPTSATPVTVIVNVPAAPQAPPGRQETPKPKAPKPGAGLSVPKIYRKPLPVPTVPASVPAWKRYALLAAPFAPSILDLVMPSGGSKRAKYRDPLTVPQDQVANYFSTTTNLSGGGYFGGSAPGKTCDCGPKKKRGKRKKRTVCYKGSYVERATGITKRKREKIPCQA